MHHLKAEILRGLDPTNPATIQALIDHHRTTFGGWRMEGDEGQGESAGNGEVGKADAQGANGGNPDDALGEGGKKALEAERENVKTEKAARLALEKQFNDFRTKLSAALGVEDEGAKSSTDEVLATVQKQLATMQRENLVLSVAGSNKITDEDDLGLLRDFKGDDEALRKLAARLKPTEGSTSQVQPKRRTPAPDHSQGQGNNANTKPGDAGRAEAARRFAKAKSSA